MILIISFISISECWYLYKNYISRDFVEIAILTVAYTIIVPNLLNAKMTWLIDTIFANEIFIRILTESGIVFSQWLVPF